MDAKDKELSELATWQRFRLNELHGVVVYALPHESDVIIATSEKLLEKKLHDYIDTDDLDTINDLVETIKGDTVVQVMVKNPHMIELPLDVA